MDKIVRKEQFSEKVSLFEIGAPFVAKNRRTGNFVIARVGHKSERVPLTIADIDAKRGTIALVVQKVGLPSTKLCNLNEGDYITGVVGPLDNATHIEKFGTMLCAGGDVGITPMLPIIKALKGAGNRVLSVLAGRSRDLIILEDEVRANSDETIIMTDDSSYGGRGVIMVDMERLIKQEHIDKAFVIGPPIMTRFCRLPTQKYNIPTDVSLNVIMVDGTGMCDVCRLTIGGKTKFVRIDRPEFDGALVDWGGMFKRMNTFKDAEKDEVEHLQDHLNELESTQEKHTSTIKMDVEPTQESISMLTDRNAKWRKALWDSMKPKERKSIARVQIPKLDPAYRAATKTEGVSLGLTKEMAMTEARHCLDCAKPTCVKGCPININIPSFIKNIERGQFLVAARVLKNTSTLLAVCGRVCPQEERCENRCIHSKMNEPAVATGYLERSTADYERESRSASIPDVQPDNGIKVAVVGSGSAGLSFAGDMAERGYQVHMFEALHEIDGMLKYGIPEFRLPNAIVGIEIENLKKMGVHFLTDCITRRTLSIKELKEKDFKSILMESGTGLPSLMGIPGENAISIMSFNEYPTRIDLTDAANTNADTPINLGKKTMIVGGGNTTMDSCRTAKHLGADVTLVYCCSETEMPVRLEEVKHAKEEGIHFMCLHNPVEYLMDERGVVSAAVLQVMRLGESDASSRHSPVPVEGQAIAFGVDQVVVAIGVSPSPLVPKSIQGLKLGRKNTTVVNDQMQPSRSEIHVGGDIVRGSAAMILAIGDGRRVAASIDMQLRAEK